MVRSGTPAPPGGGVSCVAEPGAVPAASAFAAGGARPSSAARARASASRHGFAAQCALQQHNGARPLPPAARSGARCAAARAGLAGSSRGRFARATQAVLKAERDAPAAPAAAALPAAVVGGGAPPLAIRSSAVRAEWAPVPHCRQALQVFDGTLFL